MRTQVTSEQLLAALQSGVAPESLDAESIAPVVTEAPAEPALAVPAPAAVEPVKPTLEAPKVEADFVTYLKTEVSSLKADVTAKDAKIAELQAEVANLKASSSPRLLDIVRTACTRQAIALNSALIGVDKLQGEALADQWVALDEAIVAKFKVGAQSRASADAVVKPVPAVPIAGPRAGKTFKLL